MEFSTSIVKKLDTKKLPPRILKKEKKGYKEPTYLLINREGGLYRKISNQHLAILIEQYIARSVWQGQGLLRFPMIGNQVFIIWLFAFFCGHEINPWALQKNYAK